MGVWYLLWIALAAIPPADDAATGRKALRAEAEAILKDVQTLQITPGESRRRVERLLKALRSWAEDAGVELHQQSRAYSSPPKGENEELTADNCPLFFKETLDEEEDVCPLDLSRSEVWGASVMFCRYDCAPIATE